MVDDHLGTVDEVTELGFPNDQHIGLRQAVAIVKAKNGRFGEETVVDAVICLIFSDIIERLVALTGIGVIPVAVTL